MGLAVTMAFALAIASAPSPVALNLLLVHIRGQMVPQLGNSRGAW